MSCRPVPRPPAAPGRGNHTGAVQLSYLREFVEKRLPANDPDMAAWSVVLNIVQPATAAAGSCAFLALEEAEQYALPYGASRPYYFVSHAWSRPLRETVSMLTHHFRGRDLKVGAGSGEQLAASMKLAAVHAHAQQQPQWSSWRWGYTLKPLEQHCNCGHLWPPRSPFGTGRPHTCYDLETCIHERYCVPCSLLHAGGVRVGGHPGRAAAHVDGGRARETRHGAGQCGVTGELSARSTDCTVRREPCLNVEQARVA